MEFKIVYATQNKRPDLHQIFWYGTRKPCEGAYQKQGVLISESKPMHPKYQDLKYYPAFTSDGINHRIENKWMIRDIPDETWYVEINSLEDLLSLQKEVGETLKIHSQTLVIDDSNNNYGIALD